LGSGITLAGSGPVTFSSGNSQVSGVTYTGSVTDAGTSGVTVNTSATTAFVGKVINITSPLNVFGTANFTSNGTITYNTSGNIPLGNVVLAQGSSGSDSFTSTTGNIYQVNTSVITNNSTKSTISFVSNSTGNNGVTLSNSNLITPAAGNTISISSSGNSSFTSNSDIYLSNVTVFPGLGQTPNSTDVQLTVTSTSGNIAQSTGSSIYVWGNTTFIANNSKALNGIKLQNGGNNFGNLTLTSTSGNVSVTESATSAFNSVTAVNFTAASTNGDIISTSNGSNLSITGNTYVTANKGSISLTNANNSLTGGSGYSITFNAAGNVSLTDTRTLSVLNSGSFAAGNLIFTNNTGTALITDQAGSSKITVLGSANFITNGSSGGINFTGANDSFGALLTRGNNVTIFNKGDLVLLPGSVDTNAFITATGNISTSLIGGSVYGLLSLTSGGNVTLTNDIAVTSSLLINAPGIINLSALSNYVDFARGTITPIINGTATTTATSLYLPPSP